MIYLDYAKSYGNYINTLKTRHMNAKVTIDFKKKTFTVEGPIEDLRPSASGDTESMVSIRNEGVGVNHPADGRPVKMSLLLYVRTKDKRPAA